MKKHLLYKIAGIILLAFGSYFFSNAQSTPAAGIKDKNGNDMLWGDCKKEALEQAPYNTWYIKTYKAYTVDSSLMDVLQKGLKNKTYTIFFGTWCGDSQREVPRMLKILAHYGVQPKQIKLVAVSNHLDAYKQSIGREEKGLYIHRVPTLLITKGKKEFGRIIESPVESLEKDMAKIITGMPYQAAYGDVANIIEFIKTTPNIKANDAIPLQLHKWKESVKEVYHLNSVGYLLATSNELDKAITVFTISTRLFPADAMAYKRLGEIYTKLGNMEQATVYYKKVLELDPANDEAKKMLGY